MGLANGHPRLDAARSVTPTMRPVAPDGCDILPFTEESLSVVCASDTMRNVLDQLQWFAQSDAPVLVTGESGTGKEVIAQLVHQQSRRASHRYVRVNCAALSESLIESELFGHERGAFTGATEVRIGRFEWAGEGTILLDEVSEIPPALQAKLLRVLEEEEFQRVGGNRSLALQARIVATSNRDLRQEILAGRFRKDLFYRLSVLPIHLPPLRERTADIPPLAEYFLQMFRHEGRGVVQRFSAAAMRSMELHSWPGNVRELRNFLRRLCVLCPNSIVVPDDLERADMRIGQEPSEVASEGRGEAASGDLLRMSLREAEQLMIRTALARTQGNRTAAARQLGITTRTLHNRLKQDPELLNACSGELIR
jgi:DNA-binding NtrC family response regulator